MTNLVTEISRNNYYKKINLKKLKKSVIALLSVALLTVVSCKKETIIPSENTTQKNANENLILAKASGLVSQSYTVASYTTRYFTTVPVLSNLNVSLTNTGTRGVSGVVKTSTNAYIGSFYLAPGTGTCPVYTFSTVGLSGTVKIELSKDNPSGGSATGMLYVSSW